MRRSPSPSNPWRDLCRVEDGGPSPLRTRVAVRATRAGRLVVRFRSAWWRLTPVGARHDDDLYEGDVVELFVAPDAARREVYYEIEVNPEGRVFDARIDSPRGERDGMRVDRAWRPAGLDVMSRCVRPGRGRPGQWEVTLSLPLAALGPNGAMRPGEAALALNVFRIDRRSLDRPVFLALSPSLRQPADFHVPAAFEEFIPRP